MTITVDDRTISRIKVVDDSKSARRAMSLILKDIELEAVEEQGPLKSLAQFVDSSISAVDAMICDHMLTTYAVFNGAAAVAYCYQKSFPALLCTAWNKADIDTMRPYRRRLPVVINAKDVSPDTILQGFEICIRELKGQLLESRKPWRSLIRIVEVNPDAQSIFVIISSWNSSEVIKLPLALFPSSVHSKLQVDIRFHAKVNIGAEEQNELYFEEFEF